MTEQQNLIKVDEFCFSHRVEISFIFLLQKSGLIEVITLGDTDFFYSNDLPQLEKFIHLHYELDINVEGIESIFHLLNRMSAMEKEIILLKNKTRFYELIK